MSVEAPSDGVVSPVSCGKAPTGMHSRARAQATEISDFITNSPSSPSRRNCPLNFQFVVLKSLQNISIRPEIVYLPAELGVLFPHCVRGSDQIGYFASLIYFSEIPNSRSLTRCGCVISPIQYV
jgi:hypothetical protein